MQRAIAALIMSTERKSRKLNLLEVADQIDIARKELGSLEAVSDKIGISTEMLRQFLAAKKLSFPVKKLVTNRKIDEVDIAYRLSQINLSDQIVVARRVVEGQLTSKDVRDIVTFRKTLIKVPIDKIIRTVLTSKNIKEYIAQFIIPSTDVTQKELMKRFAKIIGKDNIRSLKIRGFLGFLAVTPEGRQRFQKMATDLGITKSNLIEEIIGKEIN